MSSSQSSNITNQEEGKKNFLKHQRSVKSSQFVDMSTRDGRSQLKPYSIKDSSFNRGNNRGQQQSQNNENSQSYTANTFAKLKSTIVNGVSGIVKGFIGVFSQDDNQQVNQHAPQQKLRRTLKDQDTDQMQDLDFNGDDWQRLLPDIKQQTHQVANNFSFNQTPLMSIKQSKHKELSHHARSESQKMSQVVQDTGRQANFENLHIVEKNRTPLSIWQRYNQRPYTYIKAQKRKARFIDCVKVIAEHKAQLKQAIATSDNRRFYLCERLISTGNDRVRQPIPRKRKVDELNLIRKRQRIVPPGHGQERRQNQIGPNYNAQRFKTEDEDQQMLTQSQTVFQPDLERRQKRIIQRNFSHFIDDEESKRLIANSVAVNQVLQRDEDDTSSQTHAQVDQRVLVQLIEIVTNKIKEKELQKRSFNMIQNSQQTSTAVLSDLEKKLKEQQEELMKRQMEETLKENKKMMDNCFKEIMEAFKKQQEEVQNKPQASLLNEEVVEQLAKKMFEYQVNNMQSQESMIIRANSLSSNKNSQAGIAESPRIDLSMNISTSEKKNDSLLEPIKEVNSSAEKSKNKEKINAVKFQLVPPQVPSIVKNDEEEKQENKKKEGRPLSFGNQSPSFGKQSPEKSQVEKQESFISEAISTPDSKKQEDQTKPVISFAFKTNQAVASSTTSTGSTAFQFKTGPATNNDLPTMKILPPPSTTTQPSSNVNLGSNTTQSSEPPKVNPFINAQNPAQNQTITTNPLISTTTSSSNPFLQPKPATNVFSSNSNITPMNNSFQSNDSVVSNPFINNIPAQNSTGISNQFQSPFVNNGNAIIGKQSQLNNCSKPPQFNFSQNNMNNNTNPFSNQGNTNLTPSNPFATNNQSINLKPDIIPTDPGNFQSNPFSSNTFPQNNFGNNMQPSNNMNQPSSFPINNSFAQPQNIQPMNPFAKPQSTIQNSSFNTGPSNSFNNPFTTQPFNSNGQQPSNNSSFYNNNTSNTMGNPFTGGRQQTGGGIQYSFGVVKKDNPAQRNDNQSSSNNNDDDGLFSDRPIYKARRTHR